MLQEIPADENGYVNGVHGKSYEEYKQWLIRSDNTSKGIGLEDWMVPQNTYWLYVEDKPVGMAKLRHYLTEALSQSGGHCGYSIRPSERNKGYGTILLSLIIEEAKKLDLDRILVTVENHNEASIKVALNNGGIIEAENDVRKFIWIDVYKR